MSPLDLLTTANLPCLTISIQIFLKKIPQVVFAYLRFPIIYQHFLLLKTLNVRTSRTMFKRSMKNFKIEDCLLDLDLTFSSINITDFNKSNISQGVLNFTFTFNSVLDKHAPLTVLTRKEKRLQKKPWITPGINNLLKKVLKKNSTNSEKEHYKKYLNKLTQIKNVSNQHYHQNLLSNWKSSSKT